MIIPLSIRQTRRAALFAATLAFAATSFDAAAETRSTFAIDPARSHIAFSIDAVGYPRTTGEFRKFAGKVVVDFDHWEKSAVAFHVDARSVDVGSSSFGDYVRSNAFLDTDHFPSIDFVSDHVERVDDHTLRVSGEVTLLGMTRPLTVVVAARRDGNGAHARLGFEARTTIDRLEFGMNAGFPLVSKDVELVISTEAVEL